MKHIIKLELKDIKTGQLFENVQIECSDGNTLILLSKDAAEELKNDLIALAERWQNLNVCEAHEDEIQSDQEFTEKGLDSMNSEGYNKQASEMKALLESL